MSPTHRARAIATALYGFTVIRDTSRPEVEGAFIVYPRDCPADKAHYTDDLAPFTFPTEYEATLSGVQGHYAYKR